MQGLFGQDEIPSFHRFAQIALERGLEKPGGLTYGIPEALEDLRPGERVMVPLGRGDRPVGGIVLAVHTECDLDPAKLKAITARDRASVRLPEDLLALAEWISSYYVCPLGMVLSTLLPAAVKKGTGLVNKKYLKWADPAGPTAIDALIEQHRLTAKQADVLRAAAELAPKSDGMDPKELAEAADVKTQGPIQALTKKGIFCSESRQEVKAVWAQYAVEPPTDLILSEDQKVAVEAITSAREFTTFLLHGVTGSGKTEVYIRAIEKARERGERAIVLVPEIALTPQTAGRFIGRFERVAVLHSGLTAAQRHQQWALIQSGWAHVVVGARSAVFAPLENLGLIIVDEEHDNSYKQDNAPRYHARDVAIKRAQMLGAVVVLGSATPALESYQNAQEGRFKLLRLPNRVTPWPLPRVQVVDLLEHRRKTRSGRLISQPLAAALRHTLEVGGQVMLLLNRRGFANYIACPDHNCGWVKTCDHCDVNMVYHKEKSLPRGGSIRCHYCTFEQLLPEACPSCGKRVTTFGLGVQRVEEELGELIPNVPVARMDSDTMRTGRDYQKTLDAFGAGELRVLVGTQMIAKGLDFPNVQLVGVISADTALNLPDFRAAERTFQLICQVAGRSGRGPKGGRVIVQTFMPDHPAVEWAAKHDYQSFAKEELALRREVGLPPAKRMARVVCRDEQLEQAEAEAAKVVRRLNDAKTQLNLEAEVSGPAPAPIARIGGLWRQQVEIIGPDSRTIQTLLSSVRQAGLLTSDARTAVDVDPTSLL
jgi:primosomal protein N' (replication factor Y)